MTPKRENRNADEGGAHASAQAGAHAPAHAQHTNARTYEVFIATWDALGRLHTGRRSYKTYTHAQFVRMVADKHAKGYALYDVVRYGSTIDITFAPQSHVDENREFSNVGRAVMWNKAGRRMTVYAPVQEARD